MGNWWLLFAVRGYVQGAGGVKGLHFSQPCSSLRKVGHCLHLPLVSRYNKGSFLSRMTIH